MRSPKLEAVYEEFDRLVQTIRGDKDLSQCSFEEQVSSVESCLEGLEEELAGSTDPAQVYYLANQGVRCPFCHSNNIEAGTGEINAGDAFQKVVCNDCEKEWTDEYKLVGFSSDQGGEV